MRIAHASLKMCWSNTVPVLWCVPTRIGACVWHCANGDGRRGSTESSATTAATSTAARHATSCSRGMGTRWRRGERKTCPTSAGTASREFHRRNLDSS